MQKLIIAIDGPVGSGKSTLARRVAQMLGYVYVDTGAMYRALALKALRRGVALEANDENLLSLARETRIDLRAEEGSQRVFLDMKMSPLQSALRKYRKRLRNSPSTPACGTSWSLSKDARASRAE